MGMIEKLLSTLNKSPKKGSMILVTTRFQAIAQKVKITSHSIQLNGLESEESIKLFLAFVFGDEQYPRIALVICQGALTYVRPPWVRALIPPSLQ